MICYKKIAKKIIFKIFFSKGGPFDVEMVENFFFSFSKFQKLFFEKWLQWDVTNGERNKLMKFELILSIHGGITRDHLPGGVR